MGCAEDVDLGSAVGSEAGGDGEESELGHPLAGRQRSTLCVSSQVGCQMGCTFCATGASPNLSIWASCVQCSLVRFGLHLHFWKYLFSLSLSVP